MAQRVHDYRAWLVSALMGAIGIAATPAQGAAQSKEPQTVVRTLYGALSFSNPIQVDAGRIRELFAPSAQIVSTGRPDGTPAIRSFNIESFLEFAAPGSLVARDEKELWSRVERFGNVAHVLSAYELTLTTNTDKLIRRGANSVQLYYDGSRWLIASLIWDVERPGNPLPDSDKLHQSAR
jgi:hypothetical protein